MVSGEGGTSEVEDMIQDALDQATPTVQELADDLGVTADAVWSWAAGRRSPGPERLEALADALEDRSERLAEIAADLRAHAEEGR